MPLDFRHIEVFLIFASNTVEQNELPELSAVSRFQSYVCFTQRYNKYRYFSLAMAWTQTALDSMVKKKKKETRQRWSRPEQRNKNSLIKFPKISTNTEE